MRLHTERQGAFMGMNIAEFKNLIQSFTDIMSEDVCESIRTSAGSMTMRFAKMLLGEVVSNDFAETNPKAYAELISLAFGALTEKAYNRTPGAMENYDLESRMLDIKSMDFRAMDCKVLYIRCPIILKQLNLNNEVNDGIIAFGYLDYEAGLSFDVIGAARIYNNRIEISALAFNLSQHQGLFQRVGSLYQMAKILKLQKRYFLAALMTGLAMRQAFINGILAEMKCACMVGHGLLCFFHPPFEEHVLGRL